MEKATYIGAGCLPLEQTTFVAQATYCGASYLLHTRLPTRVAKLVLWIRLPTVEQATCVKQSTYSSAGYLVSTED